MGLCDPGIQHLVHLGPRQRNSQNIAEPYTYGRVHPGHILGVGKMGTLKHTVMVGEEKEKSYRGFLYLIAILTFISVFAISLRVDYLEMKKRAKAQQEEQKFLEERDRSIQRRLDSLKLEEIEQILKRYEDNG